MKIAWDLGASWLDSWAPSTDGRVKFCYQELIPIVHQTGFLGGRSYERQTEYLQYLFTLSICGLQEASCVSTIVEKIGIDKKSARVQKTSTWQHRQKLANCDKH